MIQIPVFQNQSADFEETIDLNIQLISIRLTYNVRTNYFHIRFTDPDGIIIDGIKVVPLYLLLDQKKATLNFEGDLIVLKDDASLGSEITYSNFGSGYNLYYMTEAELEVWKTTNGV